MKKILLTVKCLVALWVAEGKEHFWPLKSPDLRDYQA